MLPSDWRSDKEIIADIIKRAGYPPIEAFVRRLISDLRVPLRRLPVIKDETRNMRKSLASKLMSSNAC
jgi:hypothetical protein